MLNRRSFCIRSAASVAAAVSLTGTVEAKQAAPAVKGATNGAGTSTIPMDESKARSLILDAYRKHVEERAAQGLPPLPLPPSFLISPSEK